MAKRKELSRIVGQKQLGEGIYDMWILTELANEAKPGTFIGIYPKDKSNLLPRPISICEADKAYDRIRIVYRIVGEGTREFSTYKEGDTISILGILGNGFPIEEAVGKQVLLLGGGIGIPPMLEVAKRVKKNVTAVLGYRDANLFLKEDMEKYASVYVATEDGSVGTKGNVMDAIKEHGISPDIIFACGPMPMLKAIKTYAEEKQITAYISLEERMACGVGACLGCVCKTKEIDAHSHVHNARICTDGPVFDSREVDI